MGWGSSEDKHHSFQLAILDETIWYTAAQSGSMGEIQYLAVVRPLMWGADRILMKILHGSPCGSGIKWGGDRGMVGLGDFRAFLRGRPG